MIAFFSQHRHHAGSTLHSSAFTKRLGGNKAGCCLCCSNELKGCRLSCRLPGNYRNLPGNYPNLLDLASTMITDGNVQPNYRPVTSKRLPIRRTSTSNVRMCTASIITLIRSNSIERVCDYRLFKPNSNFKHHRINTMLQWWPLLLRHHHNNNVIHQLQWYDRTEHVANVEHVVTTSTLSTLVQKESKQPQETSRRLKMDDDAMMKPMPATVIMWRTTCIDIIIQI